MKAPRLFAPAKGTRITSVRAALSGAPGWQREETAAGRSKLLDTFDWRVLRAGGILRHDHADAATSLVWQDGKTGLVEIRQPASVTPRFAEDVPPGRLRDRLESILGLRALLPLAETDVRRESFRSLDAEGKTVARIVIERSRRIGGSGRVDLGWVARVEPIRGYETAASAAADLLSGLGLDETSVDPAIVALEANGLSPGSVASGLDVPLDPQEDAAPAYRMVLGALLTSIIANVPGTIDDLDSEFLHDLRVASRRSRSVLSSARNVLPEHTIAALAPELRWLSRATSDARDLDVWVLGWDELAASVPAPDRPAMPPLYEHIADRRAAAHETLNADLGSERFEALLDRAQAALAERSRADHRDASRPIRDVARARVERAVRKLLDAGRRIADESPPTALHDLRKRAKRLRYLLECFRGVLDGERVASVVADLKQLQNVLGDFQDFEVQAHELRTFARDMQAAGTAPADTLLAIGALSARLDLRQQKARARYATRFRTFDAAASAHEGRW